MRANEFILNEVTDQQRIDFKKSVLDYQEIKLLKLYKQELLQKLEQAGINPDMVGRGVSVDPKESLPIQTKLEIYRSQIEAIKQRLKQDATSFASPTKKYQQQRSIQRKLSGPVKTMTGQEYMAKQGQK